MCNLKIGPQTTLDMRTVRQFMMATVLFVATSCTVKEIGLESEAGPQIIVTASFDDTKAALADNGSEVFWEPQDSIKLFFDGVGSKFTSIMTEKSRVARFSGILNTLIGFDEESVAATPIWGLYPYEADAVADNESVTTVLNAEQEGVGGTFGRDYVLLGKSASLSMPFYAVCGGVRFSLTQEGVNRVTFEGRAGETLAGRIKVCFEDGVPAVREVTEGQTSVTLNAPAGGCFEPGKWYYIVAVPGTLADGFKMTFYKDESVAVLESSASVTVRRSTFGSLADVDAGLAYRTGPKTEVSATELHLETAFGSYDSQSIDVHNAGDSPLEFYVENPWIDDFVVVGNEEGERTYTLVPGQTRTIRFVFVPSRADYSCGDVILLCSTDRNVRISLNGSCSGTDDGVVAPAVDLGLSVKWAAWNVGARTVGGLGKYFSWGETETKSLFRWSTYMWCGGRQGSLTKYCTLAELGDVDGKKTLDPEDDAASAQWGEAWRMPTVSELNELKNDCTWEYTTVDGVEGFKVTSLVAGHRDKYIFIPYSGSKNDYIVGFANECTILSNSTGYDSEGAWGLICMNNQSGGNFWIGNCPRVCGYQVRAVTKSDDAPQTVAEISSTNVSFGNVTVGETVYEAFTLRNAGLAPLKYTFSVDAGPFVVDGLTSGSSPEFTLEAGEEWTFRVKFQPLAAGQMLGSTVRISSNAVDPELSVYISGRGVAEGFQDRPAAPVDLGLSVKWASWNVGAASPEDAGEEFAWGEILPKFAYVKDNYKWYDRISDSYVKDVIDRESDVASVRWGSAWRIPSDAEWNELLDKCSFSWSTNGSLGGYEVVGPNGQSIFLPATAPMQYGEGPFCEYWTSTAFNYVDMSPLSRWVMDTYPYFGKAIRPVMKPSSFKDGNNEELVYEDWDD